MWKQAGWKLKVARNRPIVPVQNIDTDQIIPAEYLTLVPSKVLHLDGCGTDAKQAASCTKAASKAVSTSSAA